MRRIEHLLKILQRSPRFFGRGLIKAYRYTLSPMIGFRCRHLPTCSEYADEALDRYGLWAGGWMALARILRCHPFGTSGLDFVPATLPVGARWFLPWRYGRWWWRGDKIAAGRS
jgi:putative membrane protein insertion efficiency factor